MRVSVRSITVTRLPIETAVDAASQPMVHSQPHCELQPIPMLVKQLPHSLAPWLAARRLIFGSDGGMGHRRVSPCHYNCAQPTKIDKLLPIKSNISLWNLPDPTLRACQVGELEI